jgi:hypothetical protein
MLEHSRILIRKATDQATSKSGVHGMSPDSFFLLTVTKLENLNKTFVRHTNQCSGFWFDQMQQPVWGLLTVKTPLCLPLSLTPKLQATLRRYTKKNMDWA